MHNLGVADLDIRPQNILVGNNNEYKISDFGMSKRSQDDFIPEGDRAYLAPESLKEDEGENTN